MVRLLPPSIGDLMIHYSEKADHAHAAFRAIRINYNSTLDDDHYTTWHSGSRSYARAYIYAIAAFICWASGGADALRGDK